MTSRPAASDKAGEAPGCTATSSTAHLDSAEVQRPPREKEGRDAKQVLVVPKQAMTAALGPRRASDADTEEGDVPMPWWYTPRRLLVRCPLETAEMDPQRINLYYYSPVYVRFKHSMLCVPQARGAPHSGCKGHAGSPQHSSISDVTLLRLSLPVPSAAAVLLCVGPGVRGPGAAVQQRRHRHAQHRPQQCCC